MNPHPLLRPLALLALALHAHAALAQSEPSLTVYGTIDLGLVKQNHPDLGIPILIGTALAPGVPNTVVKDGVGFGSALGGNGLSGSGLHVAQGARSRLGFKGVEPLGAGLSARFELEHRFYPDTGGLDTKERVFWDKAVVGLTSTTWGDLSLGRDYMPAFYPQYLLDPWLNEGVAQMGANLYAFSGYLNEITRFSRYNNGVFYRMRQGGFTGMLGASLKEDGGTSPMLMFKNRWGFSTMYSDGPWFWGLGYDTSTVLQPGANEHMLFTGLSYDAGFIKPRLSYSQSTLKAVGTFNLLGAAPPVGMGKRELHTNSWTLAATIPTASGFWKIGGTRLQWDDAGPNRTETRQRKFSLGYEHTLSKRTALYADVTQGKTATLPTLRAWDMGMKHKF